MFGNPTNKGEIGSSPCICLGPCSAHYSYTQSALKSNVWLKFGSRNLGTDFSDVSMEFIKRALLVGKWH